MTIPARQDLPGTRPCPACPCCQFGLCMLAARQMDECCTFATDPAGTRGCPCSAVLRRPLISAAPHQWPGDGGPCRRCHVTRPAPVPNCWFHPHQAGRGGSCTWCGLRMGDQDTPADCPGMPRSMPVLAGGDVITQALYAAIGGGDEAAP